MQRGKIRCFGWGVAKMAWVKEQKHQMNGRRLDGRASGARWKR